MSAKQFDKFAGILALSWTAGGYVVFCVVMESRMRGIITVIFLGWLAIALLLVIAGFKRGKILGAACAICIIVFMFGFPYYDIARTVENLSRKDEYAYVPFGAPECTVKVIVQDEKESKVFEDAVQQFAIQYGIHRCRQKKYMQYSGPPRPQFKGDHVAIWASFWWRGNPSPSTEGLRMAPYDEAYPDPDFKKLADSLVSAVRGALPGKVEVTFKNRQKP